MERIYSTTEPNDAEMLRLMLEREDIPVHLENMRGSTHATFLSTPATEIDVLVPDNRVEEATDILDEYLEGHHDRDDQTSIQSDEDKAWNRLMWLLLFILFGGPLLVVVPFTLPLYILDLTDWVPLVLGFGSLFIVLYLLYLIWSDWSVNRTS